jgi:1-acyl-sn-glycerol-3-phosphate acyltransferase
MLRDNKFLFYLYQIYKVFVFYPLLGLNTAFLVTISTPIFILFGDKPGKFIGSLWAKINAIATPMYVKTYNREKMDPQQSYVIVSNHQSQFDIFVVYGFLKRDFRWVMKMELRKVPFLGYWCYKAGHVYVDRSDHQKALDSIENAKKRIINGISILFFPEGTRSNTGELKPFKKGAFKFALDLNLPILPITIVGSRNVLPNNSTDLFPGSAKLIINDPIPIKGYTEDNIQELIDKSLESINKSLQEYTKK